jgi:hypothetical protein
MGFRWFVGLNIDDPIWDATVFTKNRDRLLAGDIAQGFFDQVWPRPMLASRSRWSTSASTARC